MSDLKIFARLTKYDESTGYFEAVAASEAVDKSREVFDYETSKPFFLEWSNGVKKASGGKSMGNIREMHGRVAAGRVLSLDFNDTEKSIVISGEAVDEGTRIKLSKGVLTGVSIGGDYAKKWPDVVNKGCIRYTAKPSEISLVDNPCNPDCNFMVVKGDGTQELRKFADPEKNAIDTLAALLNGGKIKATELVKLVAASTSEQLRKTFTEQAHTLRAALDSEGLTNADLEKLAADYLPENARDGNPLETLARLESIAAPKVLKADDPDGDEVKFADEENEEMPLDTPAHIRAAWNMLNKPTKAGKYDAEQMKAMKGRVVMAWKAMIDKAGPPAAKEASKAVSDLLLRKGLYTVAQVASLLESLQHLCEAYEYEQMMEGDDSEACEMLADAVDVLAAAFAAMAKEEAEELMQGDDDDAMEMAVGINGLVKRGPKAAMLSPLETLLAKYGARHSKEDLAKVQGIHDHAADLGAVCNADSSSAEKAASGLMCKALGLAEATPQETITRTIATLRTKAEKWDKAPAPARGVLKVVSKSSDIESATGEVPANIELLIKDAEGIDPEKRALALMKLTHLSGGRAIPA